MRIASADWRQRAAAGFPVFLRPSGFPVLPVCGVDLRRICAFLSCAALRPQAFAVLVRLRIPDSCRAPLPALGAAGIFPICPVSVSLCRRLPDLRHAGMGAAVVSQQKPHRNAAAAEKREAAADALTEFRRQYALSSAETAALAALVYGSPGTKAFSVRRLRSIYKKTKTSEPADLAKLYFEQFPQASGETTDVIQGGL